VGAAPEIVQAVFGAAFLPAGPLLALLIVGAVSNVMLMVSITIMTAAGFPVRTVTFTAPLVLLALVGHLILIPRLGQQGAALVTVVVSALGALAAGAGVYALWKVWPPVGTVIRSLAIGLVVGTASLWWPTPGLLVFAKLVLLGIISVLGYWWIGGVPPWGNCRGSGIDASEGGARTAHLRLCLSFVRRPVRRFLLVGLCLG
jgi:O-antigen/teichoic acid export membrane protein